MTEEHPFAQYVRIIGKGPHLSRPLTEEEAFEAGKMIMAGEVEPIQLGAFLCVLRVRTEEASEGAGFVRAIRDSLDMPDNRPAVDLDWASYSGKLRQLPWYILSALTLAQHGIKICMQGTEGHTPGRIYTREVLNALEVPIAATLTEAATQIEADNFSFIPLSDLSPRLQEIIELKSILGLRSPVNTFARMINPFDAPHEIQGVFHPAYRDVHRETAKLLGQPHMAVFKGEGAEVERRPQKPVQVMSLHDGDSWEETWAPMIDEDVKHDETMDLTRLYKVWFDEEHDAYASAAIIGTMAIALRLMGRSESKDAALSQARDMWEARSRVGFLAKAA